ncbi:energy-coupling factor ABC transporter ATP-binding protein [Lactococcus formosensis]|jgi:energy-coupling factor transport system ATP-binding protein|uniref:Energy-coupling factor transporter ATP-binding protein EcfA2 n=1 Tax=Lactococcus formosensis TaxID=1281486 RepID=A0A9Q8Y283_9LACT|nr:energy-coupling factor ABC transporter ATP-binding protein [Lactococcus formosensis]MCO7180838.1 energy-coupling factor ABC transporter ATP-binding protein [Lactococcus formosensis]MDG6111775.1 energy-coupling factor ABC transporter ATP-binding protein [Lactococcus formosensis]MDG6117975.1 energy-coupling factor ABC transporter ATP-binding protein [Lactococcus formosensis]MDG6120258.1 energy-coupling factor ABC transporter ATP-binding protein [Lactococcus formosensis]MDG6138772.1 energy-cou
MIKFDKVNFTYQPNTPFASRALFDINLEVAEGSYTALIGHTGSGKSTLLQHLNGLLQPTEGKVNIDDIVIQASSKQKEIKPARKKVGVVFQFPESQLFEETVLKDVAFGPQNFGVSQKEALKIAREKLELVGLAEKNFEKSPFELSGGQMRRVAIAGILAMEPKVLVLDEPTAGLDPKARIEMMELFSHLHQEGQTVVLVTHNMDDVAEYADKVYLLEKGRVISSGTPQDVFQDVDFLMQHELGVPKTTEFAVKLEQRGIIFDRLPIKRQELIQMLKEAKK